MKRALSFGRSAKVSSAKLSKAAFFFGTLDHHTICLDTLQASLRNLESLDAKEKLGKSGVLGAHDLVVDGPHRCIGQQLRCKDVVVGLTALPLHKAFGVRSQAIARIVISFHIEDVVCVAGPESYHLVDGEFGQV